MYSASGRMTLTNKEYKITETSIIDQAEKNSADVVGNAGVDSGGDTGVDADDGGKVGPPGSVGAGEKKQAARKLSVEDEFPDERCGCCSLKPDWLQGFLRPAWFLVFLSLAGAMQGMLVNGFVNVVISTLERRFEISSTQSGTIASCYDIASVICLIPVSYFGGRGNKPLYLGLGVMVMCLGSFVFSTPHFTTGLYVVGKVRHLQCELTSNVTTCQSQSENEGLSMYKFVFFLGQLLHGAGASPLFTLGIIYLDENLPVGSTSLYTGIFYTFAIFGPGVGYLAGGAFLTLYTDIDKVYTAKVSIQNDNPRWVGAWWIGFLICGVIIFLVALPFFAFPPMMPDWEMYVAEREEEVFQGQESSYTRGVADEPLGLRHISASFRVLLKNPTFMFLNVSAAAEGCVVSGISTFGPKLLEFQFGIPSSAAAQYAGMVAIPGGGGGMLLGGWLVKHFDMNVRTILKFSVVSTVLTFFFSLVFLMSCPNVPFAGISNEYQQPRSSGQLLDAVSMDHSCNAGCGCSLYDYQPVCGRDNVMYYSPCYAGCLMNVAGTPKKYTDCKCILPNNTVDKRAGSPDFEAEGGKCLNDCVYLLPFLGLLLLMLVFLFITAMPALTASLRCVRPDQRSFALGIQWIIARCLGSIPGPIIFGKMLDTACLVWQQNCDGDGACFYYDNVRMSRNMLGVTVFFMVVSCLSFFLALIFYRPVGPATVDVAVEKPATGEWKTEVAVAPKRVSTWSVSKAEVDHMMLREARYSLNRRRTTLPANQILGMKTLRQDRQSQTVFDFRSSHPPQT